MDKKTLISVTVAIFAAIICVSGFFSVPVPGLYAAIVLQNLICILTAVLLGGVLGAAPTALFFAAGVLGLPVFAGAARGGFQVLTMIGGGYKIGWVFGALIAGLIAGKPSVEEKKITVKNAVRVSVALVAGMILLYFPEIFYVIAFKKSELGIKGSLILFVTTFFAPYILVDLVKSVIGILIALKIRPTVAQYLYD
ncbi:MAG: biotin transporter BioY [Treponema sp.]|nr:biotin transporter BioY [Treponema sp.]